MKRRHRVPLLLGALYQLGEVGILLGKTLRNIFRRPFEKRIFIQQIEEIGAGSLPVISLTAAFGGLVFALQTYIGFHRYIGVGSEAYGGPVISLSLVKELIPILVGLMVSGRVGSAMAAEIGTMRITEQVDALISLGADPNRYLVVPRTLASVLMLPCLTLYGDIIGIACAFVYSTVIMGVNRIIYLRNTLLYLEIWDVASGLIKAAVFGLLIAVIGCWQGLKTEGGGRGSRAGDDQDRGHRQHHDPHRELFPEQGPALDDIRRYKTMIKIVDLHKSFGKTPVLRGVDLEIEAGETMVVIGQSGSGKSVLLKHLMGILKPDKGKIMIDGLEITRLGEEGLQRISRKFGMLFQSAALFDSLTVGENVSFGLERYTDYSPAEIGRIVAESLTEVGLEGIEGLMPYELSGGMRKRVGLARAIAYGPEIILYDEPSTGIDPIRADSINDLINDLKRDLRVTSVVITHDMVSSYKVADRIAMLYEGRIIEIGTPAEIQASSNPIIQQFIHGRARGPITDR